jgi:mRNA interferase RelE/StbE
VSWDYSFDARALRELRKLGKQAQKDIIHYLDTRVACDEDPRRFGKGLRANLSGLWRYRVGDYRILCRIEDGNLTVLVISVGHRRDVYEE